MQQTRSDMKGLILVLAFLLPFQVQAQEISEYFQIRAAERVKQVLKDFESAFGVLTNPYVTDPDERADANNRMWASVRTDARFTNDLVPQNKGSKRIDFAEYCKIASAAYQQSGISLHFEWEQAELKPIQEGYLALFYGTKSIYGKYQNQKLVRQEDLPCRAGVFVTLKDNQVTEAKIGFIDTNLSEKGRKLISLTSRKNPLEFVTLTEVVEQLALKISQTIPQKSTRKLSVEELTFNGHGVSNDFSKQLTGMIKSSLTRLNHDIAIDTGGVRSSEHYLTLKGDFIHAGNFLKINVRLFDIENKAIGSKSSSDILLANIAREDIEPDVHLLKEAEHIRDITSGSESDTPAEAHNAKEIFLEVGTDKGFGPQTYREGDIMKLKIRVNKACTVRLIYRDAAGNLIRLRNNDFEIRTGSVNQWVEIPERFQCAAPFGLETLFAYATTGTFKPIGKLRHSDGYTFIMDDLKTVIGNSMDSSVAKCIVPITTQPKRVQRIN